MLKSKSILIPNISQKQQDLADKWWSEHSCIDKNSNFKDDCDKGGNGYWVKVTYPFEFSFENPDSVIILSPQLPNIRK